MDMNHYKKLQQAADDARAKGTNRDAELALIKRLKEQRNEYRLKYGAMYLAACIKRALAGGRDHG